MRRISQLALSLAVLLSMAACSDQPSSTDPVSPRGDDAMQKQARVFTAHLSGPSTGATGQAIFRVSADGMSMDYQLIVANITDVTVSHIHLAPVGVNGPVIVWLYPAAPPPGLPTGPFNGLLASGTITVTNIVGPMLGSSMADLIDAITAGNTYVNVHTVVNPGGEIRGQIR